MAEVCKTQKVLRPFVNRVTDWMAEQGISIPNPKLYKRWRDSAPIAGAGGYREWLQEQGMKSDGTPLAG
jgi:predicted oxidoreductase